MPLSSQSSVWRALLALALLLGFYLLAVGVAVGLLLLPFLFARIAGRLFIWLVLLCFAGAALILWSVFPRPERFRPPGPQLHRQQHPRLFAELDKVARAVGQEMPAEVYLTLDVAAWVGQRGGTMGLGGRRMMGLGLPLLQALTVPEFRAVMVHEFGHYHAGDTEFGPWLYQTRAAVERTLRGLSGQSLFLDLFFISYSKMLMQATHAVTRHQEAMADHLAARIVGARPYISGLRAVHTAGIAYPAYWNGEVVPALRAGYRPPLADGFRRFMQAAPVVEVLSQVLNQELEKGRADPSETHPPLRERIAALQRLPRGPKSPGTEPATSLLSDVPCLESQLLATLGGKKRAQGLKALPWSQVGVLVHLPEWQSLARAHAAGLAGVTPASLPELASDLPAFARRFAVMAGGVLFESERDRLVVRAVGAGLIVGLLGRGWMLQDGPGDAVRLRRGEVTIEPFSVLADLASGELAAEEWRELCAATGIAELDLGRVDVDDGPEEARHCSAAGG